MSKGWGRKLAVLIAAGAVAMASAGVAGADDVDTFSQSHGNAPALHGRDASPFGSSGGDLVDHGGPVLPSATLYAIWWGPQANFASDEKAGIENLLSGFGGSKYLQVAKQYMRGATLSTSFGGSLTDYGSTPPSKANTSSITNEIAKVLAANSMAPDPNAIYLVFTSNFPKGGNYCAWHSGATINGVAIAQAYMPNTTGIAGCDPGNPFTVTNPYSAGTRSVANVTSHETMEAITDKLPGGSTYGWIDSSGSEISDKCAWQFGSAVQIGSYTWTIQKNWSNDPNHHGCIQEWLWG
ncbi:MAG TPA: hypothetical protein VFR41_09625 [Acidimicrobiia bacterium]|nr:hypothetical protein [Acidimicrobiia bacterium]